MAPESVKDLFTLELTALGGVGVEVETASLVESESQRATSAGS